MQSDKVGSSCRPVDKIFGYVACSACSVRKWSVLLTLTVLLMLHKCANTDCSSLFRRLTQGKLFQVEMECLHSGLEREVGRKREKSLRRVEYYWLCDACCQYLTLVSERGRGMMTVPLPTLVKKPVASALPPETLASSRLCAANGRIER
jgi:hypothetical protein